MSFRKLLVTLVVLGVSCLGLDANAAGSLPKPESQSHDAIHTQLPK